MTKKFFFDDFEFYRMQRELEAEMKSLRERERARAFRELAMSDAEKMLMITAGVTTAVNQMAEASQQFAATAEHLRVNVQRAAQEFADGMQRTLEQVRWEATGIFYELGVDIGEGIGIGILSPEEIAQCETAGIIFDYSHDYGWDEIRGIGWVADKADRIWTRLIFAFPVWLWKDRKMQRARDGLAIRVNRMIRRILKIRSPSLDVQEYMIAESARWAEMLNKYCRNDAETDPDPEYHEIEMDAETAVPIDVEATGDPNGDFTIEVRRGIVIEHDPEGDE